MDKKKILKYAFAAGVTIGIAIAVVILISGSGKKAGTKEAGPEAVVEAFTKAMAAGDFDTAYGLCDTVRMRAYIENYRKVWDELLQEDSVSLAIASSMLSGAGFEVSGTGKGNEGRIVYYSIEAEGNVLERKAEVVKDEGEWRVAYITEAK